MPPAPPTVTEQALALAERGAVAEAYRLLENAIAAGDGGAAAVLADWRLSGTFIRRDLSQARDLYGKAANRGIAAAEAVYTALLANGAGGSGRQWSEALGRLAAVRDPLAARQLRLIESMALAPAGDPAALPEAIPLHPAPRTERIPAFLSADECRYLIDRALPALQPAVVVHPQTGQQMRNPVRTASSAG